jgi:hypothetical protein
MKGRRNAQQGFDAGVRQPENVAYKWTRFVRLPGIAKGIFIVVFHFKHIP